MTSNPVITLTISNVSKLEDVLKWAEIAEAVGVGPGSPVEVTGHNSSLSVSKYALHVPWPHEAEDDE